jgi:benzoate/toluate 1,2-dioxygenase beta subunit
MTSVEYSDATNREIEQLLYEEASYLDRPDLDAWIDLFTQDGTYWMPAVVDQKDPLNHISLFYDDRVIMEVRRRNFVHPRSASRDYPVRSSHIISNIRVQEVDESSGDCTVTSNFHCFMYYVEKMTPYAGTYTHELVRENERYKIKKKRVDLINCDAVLGTIIIYI